MIYGKGVVKKYSREYVRTLKNGTKKKYKTQQIQITVPKQEDIYEDGEEVLIFPSSSNEDLEDSFEVISTLELSNNILTADLEKAKIKLDQKNSTIKDYEEKIRELEENVPEDKAPTVVEVPDTKLLNSYNELKEDYDAIVEKLESNKQSLESYKNLKEDYDSVVKELESNKKSLESYKNLKEDYENISKELESNKQLLKSYNDLKEDYNTVVEELESIKHDDMRNNYMMQKYKNFILNSE